MEIRRSFTNDEVPAALLAAAQDERLSCGARGLLLQILTQGADDWEANVITLSKRAKEVRGSAGEGRDSMRGLLNELRSCGYVTTRRRRAQRGQWGSFIEVRDSPQDGVLAPPTAQPPSAEAEIVYLVGQAGSSVVKIGTTTGNPAARLKGIQTGSPVRLSVLWTRPGNVDLEDFLHDTFRDLRMEGEWFDFGEADPISKVSQAAERFDAATRQAG